jgi:GMP synthase (glutamine-hydrolysing)
MFDAMSGKILLIVHQAHSNPGRVGQLVGEFGYEPVICRHACGEPLPDSMDDYDGAVVFGGPMSANDDHLFFIRNELAWIDTVLASGKPFLGICLGAQLLARNLGARVGPHADGLHEIGYYPVRATPGGRSMFDEEQYFYQWHGEGYDLPRGSELLAVGEHFENQAFRFGNAYGIQFHPEVTREMMLRWTRKSAHRMVLPGAQSRDSHLNGQVEHDPAVDQWVNRFMAQWLAPARQARAIDGVDAAVGD